MFYFILNKLKRLKILKKKKFIKKLKYNYILIFNIATLIGMFSYDVLSNYVLTGINGVNYYAEAHLSIWNSWIHTFCMPFTVYGMLYWIVSLFTLNNNIRKYFIWFLYFLYGGHYLRISFYGALFYYLMYYNVVIYSIKNIYNDHLLYIHKYNYNNLYIKLLLIIKGLKISFISLLIQEIIGHTIGNDIQSRPEGVINAILYAMYYSSNHFF